MFPNLDEIIHWGESENGVYMIRWLEKEEITGALWSRFIRDQHVTGKYVRREGRWTVDRDDYIEHWTSEDYRRVQKNLLKTVNLGGTVFGYFKEGRMLGIAAVEGRRIGPEKNYAALSCMYVTEDSRRKGIGRELFAAAKQAAGELGAEYLYVSSPCCTDTQYFYREMGCVEASWYSDEISEKHPDDIRLEIRLKGRKPPLDVYTHCPVLTGPNLTLKQVEMVDAEELLLCYSDEKALPFFNADNCNGDDFHYTTLSRMQEAILFWQDSYEDKCFVRFAITDTHTGETFGTVEMFHRVKEDAFNHCGVLRLDLRSDAEIPVRIEEILYLANRYFYDLFGVNVLITKCVPEAETRAVCLRRFGYQKSSDKYLGQYSDYYVRERLHGEQAG